MVINEPQAVLVMILRTVRCRRSGAAARFATAATGSRWPCLDRTARRLPKPAPLASLPSQPFLRREDEPTRAALLFPGGSSDVYFWYRPNK